MILSRFFKDISAVFFIQILSRVFSFVCFVYLAKFLGVINLGVFIYILSVASILSLFIEFGTAQYIIKAVASDKNFNVCNEIINLIVLKFIQFIVGLSILLVLDFDNLVSNFSYLYLTIFYVFFEGLGQIGINILNGQRLFIKANRLTFFYEIVKSILIILIIFLFHKIYLIPLVYIITSIFFSIISLKEFSFKTYKFSFKNIKIIKYYANTFLFFFSAIAYQIYFRVDIILLKKLTSTYEVGIYGTAYKFFEVFLFLPAIISGILFPHIIKYFSRDKTSDLKIFIADIQFKTSFVLSIVILFIICFSHQIIIIFFGMSFFLSIKVMQILFLTSIIYSFNFIYIMILNASGNEKIGVFIFLTGFIVNFTLNYLLQPNYGAIAAAFITFFSEIFITILYIVFLSFKKILIISINSLYIIFFSITFGFVRIYFVDVVESFLLNFLVLTLFFIMVLFVSKKNIIFEINKFKLK